jgi:type I restriction enzyme S subunit
LQRRASDWTWARLGDICDATNGRAFKASEWCDAGLPIVRIQNLKDPNAEFNYFAGELDDRHRVRHGDLLFAWSGTPGTSFGAHIWRGPDAALNQHIFNIRFDPERLDPQYFCLALNQNVARYVAEAQGGVGLAHITKSKFLDSFIPVASKIKQLELVAEVDKQSSRLDEAVANLQRARAKLRRYKTAVLSAAHRGDLLPGVRPIGSVPLAELCEGGLFVDGDWVESKDQDPSGDVRLVQLADVGDGQFRDKSGRFLTRGKAVELGCTFLREGDLLVARMPDPLGRACLFPGDPKDCVTVVDVCILRPDRARVDRRWLMHAINAPQARQQVASLEAGSTRKRISRRNLATVVVPQIAMDHQTQIAAEIDRRLSIVREVEAEVDVNLRRAQALRQAVLARAFASTNEDVPSSA